MLIQHKNMIVYLAVFHTDLSCICGVWKVNRYCNQIAQQLGTLNFQKHGMLLSEISRICTVDEPSWDIVFCPF